MVFWTGHRISNFFSNHTRGRFYHAAQRRGKLRDCTGECGGKRSATPLWLVFVPYPSQDESLKPKRRALPLPCTLHGFLMRASERESQRDSAIKPRVASNELPWETSDVRSSQPRRG